jgi:hypothetical protein
MKRKDQPRQTNMFSETCADLPLWSGTPEQVKAEVALRAHGDTLAAGEGPHRHHEAGHTTSYLDSPQQTATFRVAVLRAGRAHPLTGTYPTFAKAWAVADDLRAANPRAEYAVIEEK